MRFRRAGHRGRLAVARVSLGLLVAGAVLPGAELGASPPAEGKHARPTPADTRELHPVVLLHPETLGVLDTELRDARGTPIGISCATCHEPGSRQALVEREAAPDDLHRGVKIEHGELACAACHDPEDRTRLRLADATRLPFREVMALCGQCHGPQLRDYRHGSHGGMAGYWDLRRGPRMRNSCVVCHDAHAPAIGQVLPAPPPRDRFTSPPRDAQSEASPGAHPRPPEGDEGG